MGLLDSIVSAITPAASIDGNVFVLAAQKYGLPTDMDSMNRIVSLVNAGMDVESAAKSLAQKSMSETSPKEGGLNASNYNHPYQTTKQLGGGLRTWLDKQGNWQGQMMPKTSGWQGEIPTLDRVGKITEYSSGGDNGQMFYPSLFQGMTPEQIQTVRLLEAGKMNWKNPKAIEMDTAARNAALLRIKMGLSPFKDYN